MKRLFLLLFVFSLLLIGCRPKDDGTTTGNNPGANAPANAASTSKNSPDWHGMYKGILPCADCEGIETILVLNSDHSYLLQTKYLGKGDGKVLERAGSIAWNTSGNTLMLAGIEDAPSIYRFADNQLTQLDLQGNEITGPQADKYILKKQ